MTDRQLAASMRFGRKVTLETPELRSQSVTGYVMGFDDNVRLAVPRQTEDGTWVIDNRAVNRDYIASYDFHNESTMSAEPVAAILEKMVKKPRDKVVAQYFPDRARS